MRRPLPVLAVLLASALLPALLTGCLPKSKQWVHPRIADPRKEDQQFVEDTQFCQGKVGSQADTQAGSAAMNDCYRRLGWQRKE